MDITKTRRWHFTTTTCIIIKHTELDMSALKSSEKSAVELFILIHFYMLHTWHGRQWWGVQRCDQREWLKKGDGGNRPVVDCHWRANFHVTWFCECVQARTEHSRPFFPSHTNSHKVTQYSPRAQANLDWLLDVVIPSSHSLTPPVW